MALDPTSTVQVISLTPAGEGHTTVNLGGVLVELVTRFNYSAQCWTMDILDDQGVNILTGLMLVPGVDILAAYLEEKKTLGGMALAELNAGDCMSPNLLGVNTKLIWTAPSETMVIP